MNVQRAFKKNNINNPLYIATNGLEALIMLRGTLQATDTIPSAQRIAWLKYAQNEWHWVCELRADPVLRPIPVIVLTTSTKIEMGVAFTI